MKSKISLTGFLCLYFSLSALCQVPEKQFDSIFHVRFPADGPGAVVLLARDSIVLYEKAFGMANLEQGLPMKMTDVFRIGSNTKQFTAVAILKLWEAGKLSLQDDITKYIPDYPTHGKAITIESLLTHTSGVKNYTGLSGFNELKRKEMTPKALVDFFKDAPMDFDPGTDFRYDNSGYILLGYIIEKITGEPYAQYIRENILQPAGMTHSFYDEPQQLIQGRISGYKKTADHYVNADFLDMSLPYAAGSLLSTAGDICQWYQALAFGRIISRGSLEKAWSSYLLPGDRPTGYGYGWFTGNVQGNSSVKHVGVVNGFVTYAAYLPG
jgi:CubicO group peptidase (beta-lactamase class C family)